MKNNYSNNIFTSILAIFVIAIKWYSYSSIRVEKGYSNSFYPNFSAVLRTFFGWIPISIGDIFYCVVALWLLWGLIIFIKNIFKNTLTKEGSIKLLKRNIKICICIYIVFNIFWGINYNRQGIASQIGLHTDTAISYPELKSLTFLLAQKVNETKQQLMIENATYPNNNNLFAMVNVAYKKISDSLLFLKYQPTSIKPSLWGWVGNYTGFTGYYNPFSGEAQLNTTAPKFLLPFVVCHEVAHQLGYAKENEANFVGYIVAVNSKNNLLLYSTYFDLYNYAKYKFFFQAIVNKDTAAITNLRNLISPSVKQDIIEMNNFYYTHNNSIEPFIRSGYNFYLKNNNQPKGLKTYDEVIEFLIAYYKKYGRI